MGEANDLWDPSLQILCDAISRSLSCAILLERLVDDRVRDLERRVGGRGVEFGEEMERGDGATLLPAAYLGANAMGVRRAATRSRYSPRSYGSGSNSSVVACEEYVSRGGTV